MEPYINQVCIQNLPCTKSAVYFFILGITQQFSLLLKEDKLFSGSQKLDFSSICNPKHIIIFDNAIVAILLKR